MRRLGRIVADTARAFYDDQMTHHAAALTYYALMSLFPVLLVGVSLLGLLGQYPRTYDVLIGHLSHVVPETTLETVNRSLRGALRHKDTAGTALVLASLAALYGATGALEAARRALNVVFRSRNSRSFLRRKLIDTISAIGLMALIILVVLLVFVGGRLADEIFRSIGLEGAGRTIWGIVRWPAALLLAMCVFASVYHITPDVERRYRFITPGAVLGVLVWVGVTYTFSEYLAHFPRAGAVYGAFGAAIFLIVWLWLTNVALLLGAELDATLSRLRRASPPSGTTA